MKNAKKVHRGRPFFLNELEKKETIFLGIEKKIIEKLGGKIKTKEAIRNFLKSFE